jgi:hypothetical protein
MPTVAPRIAPRKERPECRGDGSGSSSIRDLEVPRALVAGWEAIDPRARERVDALFRGERPIPSIVAFAVDGDCPPAFARDLARVRGIFNLLRRIDEGRDDILFFADEGGSWQVGIDWEKVFPAWFRCLSRTASPDEYGRLVVAAIDDLDLAHPRDHLEAARRPATAAQKKALAKAGTGAPAPPVTKLPR